MREFRLSPSALSYFQNENNCKTKGYAIKIDKAFETDPTTPMSMGLFFEKACGIAENDAVREKGVMWDRIEQQAEIFKRYFDPSDELFIGMEILDSQITLIDDERKEKGVLDMLVKNTKSGRSACIDLKFTQNMSNSFTYWGNEQSVDAMQLAFYKRLLDANDMDVDEFYYLVFDGSPKMNRKLIPVVITDDGLERLDNLIGSFWKAYEHWQDNSPSKTPSEQNCADCDLDCPVRYNPFQLKKTEIITY